MSNNNESYYIDQFFNRKFSSNRQNSFSNYYQPYNICSTTYFDSIINSIKTDGSSKNFMNIAYGLLLSFNEYLENNCNNSNNNNNKSELIKCLQIARNASIIIPTLQNITLLRDFRNKANVNLFNTTSSNCDGFVAKYTIDVIRQSSNAVVYQE